MEKHIQLTEPAQRCLQSLMRAWFEFERQLGRVPLVQKIEQGTLTAHDYQQLLLHLRQQVVEGARWISRGASSFDRQYLDVRSKIIGHAKEEHRDYRLIEQDYVSAGGQLETLQQQPRNIGTEALHGYLMHRASQTNPVDLLGAMWIIEGLGEKMASGWAEQIEKQCPTLADATTFMRYHGANDENHMNTFYHMLNQVVESEEQALRVVKTAQVVGRLYALQLEEIDHGD